MQHTCLEGQASCNTRAHVLLLLARGYVVLVDDWQFFLCLDQVQTFDEPISLWGEHHRHGACEWCCQIMALNSIANFFHHMFSLWIYRFSEFDIIWLVWAEEKSYEPFHRKSCSSCCKLWCSQFVWAMPGGLVWGNSVMRISDAELNIHWPLFKVIYIS